MRFASAKYVSRAGMLEITFENGDHFLVAVESALPVVKSVHFKHNGSLENGRSVASPIPNWGKMRISATGDVLEVPAKDTMLEIPWDRIRTIADPKFRAHLTNKAAERAGRIGGRVKAMRLEVGQTRVTLAGKVGVPRQMIADLEAGKAEFDTDLLERIAAALGKRLRDFAEA